MGRSDKHSSKEDTQMAKRHIKRHLTSLIIREMQVKTTMKYHHIPTKMSIIKKSTNNMFNSQKQRLEWWLLGNGAGVWETGRYWSKDTNFQLEDE